MHHFQFLPLFGILMLLYGCTFERAQEQVLESYEDGSKKTTLWVYSDGEILKSNEWYNNGIKKREVEFKDNQPHGLVRQWTYLGDVVLEGKYEKGKREGEWTTFFSSKKKQSTRYYKDDHEVGDWYGVFPNGAPAFEEHYNDNGDSIGVWKKWHGNGKIAEENSCFSTVSTGTLKVFRLDGTLEFEKQCVNGVLDGRQVHYYSDGKKIQQEDKFQSNPLGRPDTSTILRTFYYGSGKVQKEEQWETYISEGVKKYFRKGVWKWFDPKGDLIKESLVHNDSISLPHQIFEDKRTDFGMCGAAINDTLIQHTVCAESTFTRTSDWKLHGTLWYYKQGHNLRYEEDWEYGRLKESRSYYIDTLDGNPEGGILASQGFWAYDSLEKKDKRNGPWRNWYKNGVLKDSLTYVGGERVGEQFGYDSTGTLTIHKTENGKNKPVIVHILGAN